MAYRVFLVDPVDVDFWTELDSENVDFTTIFSVADVSDIATRKDMITKQIAFKGSKINNEAFGNLFHLNRVADVELDNRLFFNYNPLRTVDCLIYEDSVLLLRGALRVLEINVDKYSNITYQTMVVGSVISFKDTLSEKKLEDLNFTHLQHRFTWSNIRDSWETRTERYVTGSTYSYKAFKKGSGYVYPYIDYGVTFQHNASNGDANKIHLSNFRPAVYAREYFNAIFNQPELKGFTYEIRGDADMQNRFNSLIIPTNVEKLVTNVTGMRTIYSQIGSANNSRQRQNYTDNHMWRAIQLQQVTANDLGLVGYYGSLKNEIQTTMMVNRTFTSDGYCKVQINQIQNKWPVPMKLSLELCTRTFIDNNDADYGVPQSWEVIASKTVTIPAQGGLSPHTVIEFEVGERTYNATDLLYLRLHFQGPPMALENALGLNETKFNFSEAVMRFPKADNGLVGYDVVDGDVVSPVPSEGIKQMDFVKSVMNMFNLYVYTEKERPKHLIFQTYNDFYAYAQPHLLAANALDWTGKVDYSQGLKIKSNIGDSAVSDHLISLQVDHPKLYV